MATMQPGVRESGATALTCSCWGGKAQATPPSVLRLPLTSLSLSETKFYNYTFLLNFCHIKNVAEIKLLNMYTMIKNTFTLSEPVICRDLINFRAGAQYCKTGTYLTGRIN